MGTALTLIGMEKQGGLQDGPRCGGGHDEEHYQSDAGRLLHSIMCRGAVSAEGPRRRLLSMRNAGPPFDS